MEQVHADKLFDYIVGGEAKVDKFGIIHTSVGKVSFSEDQIVENAKEVLGMILKLKPAAAKGSYVKSIYLSTTMSPGLQIDSKSVETK